MTEIINMFKTCFDLVFIKTCFDIATVKHKIFYIDFAKDIFLKIIKVL